MTTLESTNKTIQFAFSDIIHECANKTFIIETPTVVCSDRKDAEFIQKELNAFTAELSKKLVKADK